MPQKKKTAGRRSEPKLFRCTGFGNCDMVFTRSEHLARHARKHTGEKPFKCAVLNCGRMFSRFDNMVQHTHTHERTKKKDSSDSAEGKTPPMSVPEEGLSINNMMHIANMPEHQKLYTIDNHRVTHGPPHNNSPNAPPLIYYRPLHPSSSAEEEYMKYQQYYGQHPQFYQHSHQPWGLNPVYYPTNIPPQSYHPGMVAPAPHYPSPLHSPSTSVRTVDCHSDEHQSQQFLQVQHTPQQQYTSACNRKVSISLIEQHDHNDNSPSQHKIQRHSRESSTATHATTASFSNQHHRRRLSYDELSTPIQELGLHHHDSSNKEEYSDNNSSTTEEDDGERQMSPASMTSSVEDEQQQKRPSRFKSNGIDVTADEYEALQGFGKFCTEPVVREPMLMTRITTSPTYSISLPINLSPLGNISPTAVLSNSTTSQVHAFRQQIKTVQESFQRNPTVRNSGAAN